MFKVPDHQVAGHGARDGKLGPLIDESGRFYKPLQNSERGSQEASFYTTFSSDSRVSDQIRRFFPEFFGTRLIEASDGSGLLPHLILEDVVSSYVNPCIMDVKIGSRTWYPQATKDYIEKCFKKDQESSNVQLGFRVSGLQIYLGNGLGYWRPDKKETRKYNADEIRSILRRYVSMNHSPDSDKGFDRAFATRVYGGSSGILAQLLELKSWFEDQTIYHFNSCSILMIYDMESMVNDRDPHAKIKLVDFAHVVEGEGVIDHNFLGGLCSLIKFISEMLTNPNGSTTKATLENGDYVAQTQA